MASNVAGASTARPVWTVLVAVRSGTGRQVSMWRGAGFALGFRGYTVEEYTSRAASPASGSPPVTTSVLVQRGCRGRTDVGWWAGPEARMDRMR
jgi:hypothetical protein